MYYCERLHPRLSSLIDGLRWIAAGLVVASHVRSLVFCDWSLLPAGSDDPLMAAFYLATSCGHQAVIVFFVLSGFLVGGSVVADLRRGRFDLIRYLVNRVSRLYVVLLPALILGGLCDLCGGTWFNGQGLYTNGWPQVLWALQSNVLASLTWPIALANAANLQTVLFSTFGSNGPLWSLANEFWYYVLFPLCLSPAMRWRPWSDRLLLLLLAAVIALLIYPSILLYGAVWALGAGLRFLPRALIASPLRALALLVLAVPLCARLAHLQPDLLVLYDGLLALVVANLLLTMMHHPRQAGMLPGGRLHVVLADFSYSLYLLHFPMLVLLCAASQAWFGIGLTMPGGWRAFALAALFALVLYAYAWLVSLATERHTAWVRHRLLRWFGLEQPPPPVAAPATISAAAVPVEPVASGRVATSA